MSYWPGTVQFVLDEYQKVQDGEKKLSDVITGFLDPEPKQTKSLPKKQKRQQKKNVNASRRENPPVIKAKAKAAALDDEDEDEDDVEEEAEEETSGIDPEEYVCV